MRKELFEQKRAKRERHQLIIAAALLADEGAVAAATHKSLPFVL